MVNVRETCQDGVQGGKCDRSSGSIGMLKQCDLSSLVGASLIITQKVKRKRGFLLERRIGDPIHLSTRI